MVPVDAGPIGNPIEALGRLAGEADAFRGVLAARVNALADVPIADRSEGDVERFRAELSLYERALDRTSKFCEALIRSNYIERHAAIETAQLHTVAAAVTAGLELIADRALRQQVTAVIAARLRELGDPRQAV